MNRKTRKQRDKESAKDSVALPASLTTINFMNAQNLAFSIRTAACFGFPVVNVIGSIPEYRDLKRLSAGTIDHVYVRQFSTPRAFVDEMRQGDIQIVAAELNDDSECVFDFSFNFERQTTIVLGHETVGVPVEITSVAQNLYIPMFGPGRCLNTSQAGTAMATEYSRQYMKRMYGSLFRV